MKLGKVRGKVGLSAAPGKQSGRIKYLQSELEQPGSSKDGHKALIDTAQLDVYQRKGGVGGLPLNEARPQPF